MKNIKYFFAGIYFGIILIKSEVISWYRIQEMFRFDAIHMYGVMGLAVAVGAISIFIIKWRKLRSKEGEEILIKQKKFHPGLIIGGGIFGLGWALTGACPGPIYAIVGSGYAVFAVVLLSALAGVWVYGAVQKWLPH